MEKYIKSITALNELTLRLRNANQTEIDRYAESDIFWAANKNSKSPRRVYKGNIYQFEFGKNYIPEMSYEHRGLVIGVSGKLLYVLPICSFNTKYKDHVNAYHPIDNPTSKSDFFLLKSSEFAFLTHDSVLKLNDMRTVSFSRIKYRQENGYIDPKSDTYRAIEKIVFAKYFFDFSFQYDKLTAENQHLTEQLRELQSDKERADEKIHAIKEYLDTLESDEQAIQQIKQIINAQ